LDNAPEHKERDRDFVPKLQKLADGGQNKLERSSKKVFESIPIFLMPE
jgi:hypothetical protein